MFGVCPPLGGGRAGTSAHADPGVAMRFLLDVCATSRQMRDTLVEQGRDVLSALERDPRATEDELLNLAMAEQRVLVTEDTDYGELVFVHRSSRLSVQIRRSKSHLVMLAPACPSSRAEGKLFRVSFRP